MTSREYERPDPGKKGTVEHASFLEGLVGGVLSISFIVWVNQTFFGVDFLRCASDLLKQDVACIAGLGGGDKNPWEQLCFTVFLLSLATWVGSVFLGRGKPHSDPSIIDRLWSIVPFVYSWYMYSQVSDVNSGRRNRLLIMSVLATAWGARLTWNFWRKGGYSGNEDYRWVEVQSWMTPRQFEIFNLIFINIYQQLLLLTITMPCAVVFNAAEDRPLGAVDYSATVLFACLLYGEFRADNEMFDFQTEKYRRKKAGEPLGPFYGRGFIQHGLWAISRHPNYFCEVSMWWTFYMFSIAASPEQPLNWSILGAVLLTLLFVPPRASLDVTESISSRKYNQYKDYQRRVNRFIPWYPAQ